MNPANLRRLIETGKQYQKAGKLSQAITSYRAALPPADCILRQLRRLPGSSSEIDA